MTASTALVKSAKGLAELASGSYTLDLKSRQVLILADGTCTLAHLQQLRPNLDVAGIVQRLLAEGYLTGRGQAAPRPSASPPEDTAEPPAIPPETLAQVQALLVDSTRSHLGLLGSDLIRRIEAIRTADQLKACVAQWHMALRESRQGRPLADQYLQEVRLMLGREL